MLKKVIFGLGVASMLLISCEQDPPLDPWVNENLTDTSGAFIPVDLFVSGELDGSRFHFQNGRNDYSNWVREYQLGFCEPVDTFAAYIHVSEFKFIDPTKPQRRFRVGLHDCIPLDTVYTTHLDTMLMRISWPILNMADSAVGAEITYVDADTVTWSSSYGPNDGAGSDFELSAVVANNADSSSTNIAFGRFSCKLYTKEGAVMQLRNGQFKTRLGH